MPNRHRCKWASSDPLYIAYHDQEWGRPEHDERMLFEMLILEGAQAGLSWITILKKRGAYKTAFDNFEPVKVAHYNQKKIEQLLQNPGIVRNKLKINSAVTNAQVFLAVQAEFGSFDAYIWSFVKGQPIINQWSTIHEIPAQTDLSQTISKELKKRGFGFVGPTIVYAYMQSIGMVNDHTLGCFRYSELNNA